VDRASSPCGGLRCFVLGTTVWRAGPLVAPSPLVRAASLPPMPLLTHLLPGGLASRSQRVVVVFLPLFVLNPSSHRRSWIWRAGANPLCSICLRNHALCCFTFEGI
jgi:hypothetical protein